MLHIRYVDSLLTVSERIPSFRTVTPKQRVQDGSTESLNPLGFTVVGRSLRVKRPAGERLWTERDIVGDSVRLLPSTSY